MITWTQNTRRSFIVDAAFNLGIRWNDDSTVADDPAATSAVSDLSELSQGAWDQLALAVRIAVLDRVAGSVQLPLLLDDIFLTWDESRRERFRNDLSNLLNGRQVILVTHDPDFAAWGHAVQHHQMH